MSHCPVYNRIGGHAYGYIYPGPIGKILNPQVEGLEAAGVLATASSLCNACEDVCPVKIPIPDLLRRIRNESYSKDPASTVNGHGYKRNVWELMTWKMWRIINTHPLINAAGRKMMAMLGLKLPKMGPVKDWARYRTPPELAKKSLRELVNQNGVNHE
jgi:L-lactate dehydrogenase complex protein LldF